MRARALQWRAKETLSAVELAEQARDGLAGDQPVRRELRGEIEAWLRDPD